MKIIIWLILTILLAFTGAIIVTAVVPNCSARFNGILAITTFVVSPIVAYLLCSLIFNDKDHGKD